MKVHVTGIGLAHGLRGVEYEAGVLHGRRLPLRLPSTRLPSTRPGLVRPLDAGRRLGDLCERPKPADELPSSGLLDDDVLDRARDSERDVRRAARNWTDDDDDGGSRRGRRGSSSRGGNRDDDLDELYGAVRTLAAKVDRLAKDSDSKTTSRGSSGNSAR